MYIFKRKWFWTKMTYLKKVSYTKNYVRSLYLAWRKMKTVLLLCSGVFLPIRGGVKKKILFFFYFLSKGGRGGLGQSKKSLSENTQIFLTKGGGGSHPIQKSFIRKTEIFWHNLPKKGGFYKKNIATGETSQVITC